MKLKRTSTKVVRHIAVCAVVGLPALAHAQPAPAQPPAAETQPSAEPAAPAQTAPAAPATPAAPPAEAATAPATSPQNPGSQGGASSRLRQGIGVAGGLTAEQAGQRAAATSVDAEVKRLDAVAAAEDSRNTFYSLLPRVTATARYTRLSAVPLPSLGSSDGFSVGTPDGPGVLGPNPTLVAVDTNFEFPIPLNNYFLNLGVQIPLSNYLLSTTQAIRGTKALKEGAELEERAVRLNAAAEAKLAYYNWVRARLQTVVAEQSAEQAQAQLKRLRAYLAAGRVAEADVLQAEAYAAEADLMVVRAKTATTLTEQRLRTLMHAQSEESFSVGEDVMAEFSQAEEQAELDTLYREAVSKRLELRSLERSAYSLTQAAEVLDTQRYPRLEAFGNVTYANPNQRVFPLQEEWRGTWDVGVQLVWTINDLGTADADARKTEAQRAQVLAQRRSLEDALRVEILSAKGALDEARLAVKSAEQGQVAAKAALKAREQLHAGGRATSLELIQAETTLLQARLNLVEAHIALRVARVQLDHALGRDVGSERGTAAQQK